MSQREKRIARFKSRPKDFTWNELVGVLYSLGYRDAAPGKTGGSRRRFVRFRAPVVSLHKPHPGNIVKTYVINNLLEMLTKEGLL